MRGGTGDDRLAGFLGADDVEGGDGNDTLVWSNGDSNDVLDGDAGNDGVEVNGSATGGDAFTIAPGQPGGRVRFDSPDLLPFNLDIARAVHRVHRSEGHARRRQAQDEGQGQGQGQTAR